jgi:hypothetical protein
VASWLASVHHPAISDAFDALASEVCPALDATVTDSRKPPRPDTLSVLSGAAGRRRSSARFAIRWIVPALLRTIRESLDHPGHL